MNVLPTIRTSPHTARRDPHATNSPDAGGRLVAKILRELLRERTYTDVDTLGEDLKRRCVVLRIRNYGPLVHRALDLVTSNVRLARTAAALYEPTAATSRAQAPLS